MWFSKIVIKKIRKQTKSLNDSETILLFGVVSNMSNSKSFLSLYSANFKHLQSIQIVKGQIQIRLNIWIFKKWRWHAFSEIFKFEN